MNINGAIEQRNPPPFRDQQPKNRDESLAAPRVYFLLLPPRVKFFIFIGTNVGASIGWAVGEPWGMMWAFIVSGIGSAIGVYAGWWAARRWL